MEKKIGEESWKRRVADKCEKWGEGWRMIGWMTGGQVVRKEGR